MSRVLTILLALVLYANLVFLQMRMDRNRQSLGRERKALLIFPRPALVRSLSLGHINLVADYYWLKTIQYLGSTIQKKETPDQIRDYADFVTDLSPRFFEAYYYSSVIMIVNQILPEQNLALLKKGVDNLPRNKDLAFLYGFVNYYFANDHQKAAEYFYKAYQLSGYRGYAVLASRILAEEGNLELSQSLLVELAKGSERQRWSKSIQDMQKGLQQRKQLDFLDQKIELYRQKFGKDPERISDLTRTQLLDPGELPPDPMGGQYYIDQSTLRAKSSKEYHLGVYRPPEFQK